MRKRIVKKTGLGMFLTLLLTACTLDFNRATTPVSSPTAVMSALSTVNPLALPQTSAVLPTPVPRIQPALSPTNPPIAMPIPTKQVVASPEPSVSVSQGFFALRFASAPTAAPEDTFPPGTEEVFAIWDYQELQPSDRIRRIWFRDGQIWITREENWDWDKYGSSGTVLDNSVYDHEGSGLQPARYDLQLYLNDQLHQEATFVVLAP